MNLIQRGAEFENAGADRFYGNREREGGGFVEEEDYAVEFAFADAAGEGEANGIEEIAAADAAGFLQVCGDFLEALGGEGGGLEQEQGEMADDVAGGVTRDGGLGVGGLQDSGGAQASCSDVGSVVSQRFSWRRVMMSVAEYGFGCGG